MILVTLPIGMILSYATVSYFDLNMTGAVIVGAAYGLLAMALAGD